MDSSEFNEWFRMAQKDIRSARILFQYDADNEIICFHCQQAIEKYLKGYLVFMNGELQEGHSLIKLCKKAMLQDKSFGELLKDMAYVNTFYLETRYPAVDPLLVSTDDAEECLKITDKVLSKIEQLVATK
ncbi:MAG: HEPN domain-containing protein [Syntrophomonas sp.]